MNGWMFMSLLVYSTAFNISTSQFISCEAEGSGRVRVTGLNNKDVIAGGVEICYEGWWRTVCANDWDLRDAAVVCQQILNLPQSEFLVQVCTDSCFGRTFLILGIRGFNCTGTESRLIDCTRINSNSTRCRENAGFACYKRPEETTCPPMPQCATDPTEAEEHTTCTCPETECPTLGTESTGNSEGGRDKQQKAEPVTCTALGGGLGTLAAVLILILMGVVLVWVWSCHRNRNKQQDTMYKNPAYGTSHGPRDTRSPPANTSATPPTYATINEKTSKKQSNAVGYENVSPVTGGVLGDKGGEGGEGSDVDYQVLEAPAVAEYEVPVPMPMKAPPAAAN